MNRMNKPFLCSDFSKRHHHQNEPSENQPLKYSPLEESKTHIDDLYFKAFRAVNDRAACMKFIEGHTHVLEIFGITQITSAKIDWVLNPNVYVILVSAEKDGKALAGSRIHVADRKTPLPIEFAVGDMDNRIYDMVEDRTDAGTGEFCGVWNSYEIAGLGIGSMQLSIASVAFAGLINLDTLFGLCAPATYRNSIRGGFRVTNEIGINGKFYYPKEDLTATSIVIDDVKNLPLTYDDVRVNIMSLRENPISSQQMESKSGEIVNLHFDLKLDTL